MSQVAVTRDTTSSWRPPRGSCWPLGPGDTLAPGRTVIRRLAGGGAHEAFLVKTAESQGPAVAKLPRPHLASDLRCLGALRDEGCALDLLAHPAVPRRLDTVLRGPHPHLLLEHVPGPTMREVLPAHGRLPPERVASVGLALALALNHIARAGWVHLDVKPSNIVLHTSPRLLDFELARPASEAARLSHPTGTWSYMPPEQRAAGARFAGGASIGPPADVYALATSLGEALAGRLLPRESAQQAEALSGPVGAVVREALAPAPADRPTAAELAEEFARRAEPPAGVAAAA